MLSNTPQDGTKDAPQISQEILELHRHLQREKEENQRLRNNLATLLETTRKLDADVFDLLTIAQAGRAFTANPEVDRLCELLVAIIAEHLDLDQCALMIYNEETTEFEISYLLGIDPSVRQRVRYKQQEGLFWQLVSSGEMFSVVDIEGNLRFPGIFRKNGLDLLGSTCWLPLKAKDNVNALICLRCPTLTPAQETFLSHLGAQAAVAFESASLYRKLDASRREQERQMHHLSILYDLGRALNFIDDLTKLLALILDQAIALTEAQKGSLMLMDELNEELVVRVVRGIDRVVEEKILNGDIQCTRIKKGEGVAGRVLIDGEAIVINDMEEDTRFIESKDSHVANILCVPLKIHDECIGVINITNKKRFQPFSHEDLQVISALAAQAAVAINNARLYELAVTDSLTKLYIRRHFFQRLEEEMRRSRRYSHPISMLMVDLDLFKEVNDTFGHPAGDLMLTEVSRILKKSTRSTDIVCRYGGEEFALALPETDLVGATIIADRLRQEVEACEYAYQGRIIRGTISIGIATFPEHATEMDQLIRKSDVALYVAKREGRNRVIGYLAQMDEQQPADQVKALEV